MKWRVRKPEAKQRLKRRRISRYIIAESKWHRHFAWWPVRVPTRGRLSGMTMVWFDYFECRVYSVSRMYTGAIWELFYETRQIEENKDK